MALHLKIGIFDHLSLRLGGAQLVAARMAADLSQDHDVSYIHSGQGYDVAKLANAFDLKLDHVKERIVAGALESFGLPGRMSTWSYLREGLRADRALTEPYDLFIYSGHGSPPFCYARRGLAYCHFPFEARPSKDADTLARARNKPSWDRWIRLSIHDAIWNRRLHGYQTILANSRFTAGWIKELWGVQPKVLYPPVPIDMPAMNKRNTIVSVGRFITTDTKNHSLQLQLFREFLSRNKEPWTLCLVGFCTELEQDRAYLGRLRQAAQDLSVDFVVNADRKTVREKLGQAKIFWHTTALSSSNTSPPGSMEHFGIATVEAMAAGCVPIVPLSGGQPEIVQHEVSGFLCQDVEDLLRNTSLLCHDEGLRHSMACKARERSQAFSPTVFARELKRIIHNV